MDVLDHFRLVGGWLLLFASIISGAFLVSNEHWFERGHPRRGLAWCCVLYIAGGMLLACVLLTG